MAREGMRYWRLQPDARLRPWILCYWMVEPDPYTRTEQSATDADRLQLLIPDGHSEIVFRLAGSFTRWDIDEPDVRAQMCASYVIGGRSKSVFTRSVGGLRLAGVKLDPRALRALIGMPLTEFRDNTVAFADLGATALSDLEDEVANLRTVDQLVSVLDRFFLRRLTDEAGEDECGLALAGADACDARRAIDPAVGTRATHRSAHARTAIRRAHGDDSETIRADRAIQAELSPAGFTSTWRKANASGALLRRVALQPGIQAFRRHVAHVVAGQVSANSGRRSRIICSRGS